jgi:hypothetical protein
VPDNYLDPKLLDDGTLRGLREAFRTARSLQARLARDFAVAAPTFGA